MSTDMEKEVNEDMDYEDQSMWGLIAGMMLFGVGMFAAMAACAGFFNSSLLEYSILGDAIDWIWYGLFDGLTALVALYAGYAVWSGKKIGYWLGLIIATLSAGRWFLFVPGIPLWSLMMVGIWLLVIYGLIKDRKYFS